MKKPDKATRLLALLDLRNSYNRAIYELQESKKAIRTARNGVRRLYGEPSYATNRMGCVLTEIDAALRGLRDYRGRALRALANTGRSKS